MKSRIKKSSKKTDTMSLVGALLPVKKPFIKAINANKKTIPAAALTSRSLKTRIS
jgi:hypothetical protein